MSFLGTLGKIAGGALAPFTGGASLYAIPAIGAIEGAKKGGWKGALTGGAIGAGEMLIPGAISKIPGVSSAISKVGGSKIGSFLGGGSGSAAGSGGSFIGDAVNATAGQASGAGGGNWLTKVGSGISNLLGGAGSQSPTGGGTNPLATAGKGFEALANDEATNRMAKGNFTQNYDQLMMQAQNARNQNEGDALKKLAVTNYLTQKTSGYAPATIQMNGQSRTLPNFGTGHFAPSEAQKAGASSLEAQLLDRLKPGGSYTPQDLSGYANPGKMENVGKYGSLATTGLNVLDQLIKNKQRPDQQPEQGQAQT